MTQKVTILVDEDLDGLTSARIIYNFEKEKGSDVNVVFQTWDVFGVSEDDVNNVLATKPDKVYILDIGSDEMVLRAITPILESGIAVSVLDNHPPDIEVIGTDKLGEFLLYQKELEDKYSKSFYYNSTTDNCTAGIAYSITKDICKNKMNTLWAILGLKGDVAYDKKEGAPLFQEAMSQYPLLKRGFYYGTFTWGNLDFMANLFHNPRRIIFNEAPKVCFQAMAELEDNPKKFGVGWLEIYKEAEKVIVDGRRKLTGFDEYPNVKRMTELYIEWKDWKEIYQKRGNCITLDYEDYGVSIIKHNWNLGSALCNVKAGDMKKANFCINTIEDKNIVHVSGRNTKYSKIHIGKVFYNCDQSILKGGGIKEAGSAQSKILDTDIILQELDEAVERSKSQSVLRQ